MSFPSQYLTSLRKGMTKRGFPADAMNPEKLISGTISDPGPRNDSAEPRGCLYQPYVPAQLFAEQLKIIATFG